MIVLAYSLAPLAVMLLSSPKAHFALASSFYLASAHFNRPPAQEIDTCQRTMSTEIDWRSRAHHTRVDLGSVLQSEADLPNSSVREASTRFLVCSLGHVNNIHNNNMYHYVNTVEIKSANDDGKAADGSKLNTNNIIPDIEDDLNNV